MNLPKIYEPSQYEADIYTLWETSGAFQPSGEGEPYSIIMPPPNANASLHTGHAMYVIQDILTRYHRMKGDRTIYIPGADHAGFETWVVYEKHLEKQGKSRFDYNRDELYQQVWDFVAQNRGLMEIQLREMGLSCDWTKQVFTLDDSVVKVAYETFHKMWNDKLIYRGERIVNYCTQHDTSFADIEVTYKDVGSSIWEIKYPMVEGNGEIIVATTRPETMLGDVAVAVNPKDSRYKEYVGKHVTLPLINKAIPIVADDMVDFEFGTGAVKITPAHDTNDFEVGERHHLPRITVIGYDGKMNEAAGLKYKGMSVEAARSAILEDLKTEGFLVSETEYNHSVGHCYKCGTVIEPLLRDQWFVRVRPLADKAIAAIEESDIRFFPENKGRVLVNYLKNLRDWNISRQPAWGIPIPAFQNTEDPDDWIFDERVSEETIEVDGKTYARDPDTFDTWFSSSQWPFITTKYHDTGELAEFFPNSVMETAADILFPWVSRMIMLSMYRENQIPFKDVYLHGLILNDKGQKMSKSKGGVLNPQDVIKEFGSDALRLGVVASRSAGQDQAFGRDKTIAGRNFCNKLWNIARFVQTKVGENYEIGELQPSAPADHWIIRELNAASSNVAALLEEYRFAEAFETVYHTIWDKMADWYLEASKTNLEPSVMVWALEMCLKIAHPFAPFVTETLWQTLDWQNGQLITSSWPGRTDYDDPTADKFEELQKIVTEAREVLASIGSRDVVMLTTDSKVAIENDELIRTMTRVGYVQTAKEGRGLRLTDTHEHIWLDLDEQQIETYRKTLEKKLTEIEKAIAAFEHRLSSESYIKNAPEDLVTESRTQLQSKNFQATHIRHQLKHLDTQIRDE
jgi:valyl-tRNA synthetase